METGESVLEFHEPPVLKRAVERVFGVSVVMPGDITDQLDAFKVKYPSVFGDQGEFDSFSSHAGYKVTGWWKEFLKV